MSDASSAARYPGATSVDVGLSKPGVFVWVACYTRRLSRMSPSAHWKCAMAHPGYVRAFDFVARMSEASSAARHPGTVSPQATSVDVGLSKAGGFVPVA